MEQKHALGRRKSAVARVYVVAGTGNIVINGRELNDYFKEETRLTGLLAKARTLQENQRYDEAEAVYVELLKRGDVNADVYNQYMMLKMRTGAYTEAFQLLTQVKSYKDPEVMKQALWNEVVLYELTEDYETAFDRLNDYITVENKKQQKSTGLALGAVFM